MAHRFDGHIAPFCRFGFIWAAVALIWVPIALELNGWICHINCQDPVRIGMAGLASLTGILALAAFFLALHAGIFYRRHHTLVERCAGGIMPEAPWEASDATAELWPVYRKSLTGASLVFGIIVLLVLFRTPLTEVGAAVFAISWFLGLVLLAWPLWERIWNLGTPGPQP